MVKALEVRPDERPYVWAEVDLGAIRDNASLLASKARPAALCAVVKGWGYGHGITRAALAAVEGGATWLGVALVGEAVAVREQLNEPVLVLAEPPVSQLAAVARIEGVRPTLYRAEAVRAAAKEVRDVGRTTALPVHLKVDTGMHRVGATPEDAIDLARLIEGSEELDL
jgi:alanine racemase